MKIEEMDISLPNKEESVAKFFSGCETRKKFVADTKDHYSQHLKKAKHDLSRAIAEFHEECWDWTIIKAYYAMHHAGNALLSKKKGTFSKDHHCLIIALHHYKLIGDTLFYELEEINKRFSDVLSLDLAFQLRKISQYSVDEWESLVKSDAEMVLHIARKFVHFVEGEL
ncbi:MAG TPA: HEPN domain-containing protein [Candidatus Nanoarchaeia archaeon]|nr:HEPN domain-containing protein [Candidatus Nanoarchaeia archaeon]